MGVEVRSHRGPEKPVMEYPVERVEISDLVPHEETIEKELQWFIDSVEDMEHVVWPLLIGNRNHTILDGHHRAAGLKALGYKYVPAILIDYYDDDLIQLDTWYPNLKQPLDVILKKFEDTALHVRKSDDATIDRKKLYLREITAYIGNKNELYEIVGGRETIFQILRDNWLNDATYYDDKEMCLENTDEENTSIIAWSYNKKEILDHVKHGIVHLPKTTRHTLKYRVPEVNYPLEKLKK